MKNLHTGILKCNDQGRYTFEDGYYFTSGDSIEIFVDEEWLKGRIEYSHKYEDYYFLNEEEGIYIYHLSGVEAKGHEIDYSEY